MPGLLLCSASAHPHQHAADWATHVRHDDTPHAVMTTHGTSSWRHIKLSVYIHSIVSHGCNDTLKEIGRLMLHHIMKSMIIFLVTLNEWVYLAITLCPSSLLLLLLSAWTFFDFFSRTTARICFKFCVDVPRVDRY